MLFSTFVYTSGNFGGVVISSRSPDRQSFDRRAAAAEDVCGLVFGEHKILRNIIKGC
jgi:hypothetical protein